MRPILPSACSSTSAPSWSASGTFGSMRCSWNSSMRSRSEQAQALLGLGLEVLGPAVRFPAPGAGPHQAGLGRDDEVVRVRVQRLADQPLAHLGAVRIGRVDERHAELDGAAQHADHLVVVAWLAPHAGPGDLHRAVSQPHDGQVAADGELSAGTSGLRCDVAHDNAPLVVSRFGFGDELVRRGDEVDERVVADDGDRELPSDGVGQHEALERLRTRDGLSGRGEDEVPFVDAGPGRGPSGTTSTTRRPMGWPVRSARPGGSGAGVPATPR